MFKSCPATAKGPGNGAFRFFRNCQARRAMYSTFEAKTRTP